MGTWGPQMLEELAISEKKPNKAGYTATSCGWVGRGGFVRFLTFRLVRYGWTDRWTHKASYRVASPQIKMYFN